MSASLGSIQVDTCMGDLTINSISLLQEPWLCCWDLSPLWFGPELKGQDLIEQPDAHGGWAYPQFDQATTYPLPLMVSGYFNHTTLARNDNPYIGFEENLAYLQDNIFDMRSSGVPVASWEAILTMPSGDTRTADVKVTRLVPGKHVGGLWACSFQLTVVQGAFR
jgi:hypothetical protein